MLIMGINAYHGDASAALLVDGQLVAAAEEERFNRVKHSAGFPHKAIEYCLEAAGARIEDLDHIAIGRNPRAHFADKILYSLKKRPSVAFITDRFRNMLAIRDPKAELAARLGFDPARIRAQSHNVEHHRAHMASAFFASPFDEAAVVSVDGFGDFVSTMWGRGSGTKLEIMRRVGFPHSLGLFYSGLTQYLGFPKFGDEYKVMGLSAWGEPDLADEIRRVVIVRDGAFELGLDYFQHHTKGIAMTWEGEPRYDTINSENLVDLLGSSRQPGAPMEDRFKAVAASVQAIFEEAYFTILGTAQRLTPSPRLALAGGCAHNSVAAGKIRPKALFDEVFIQPAAGDAGISLGAALYVYHQKLGHPRRFRQLHSYWGPSFPQSQIEELLRAQGVRYEVMVDSELVPRVAMKIRDGNVVGWFQGRMEWGPRALGNRSIVCDPRRADMKGILNSKIKRRESFRPFAPSVLEEDVADWFEEDDAVPFMMQVFQIRPEKRALIPAVTHVDGSGRLQTVCRRTNPRYHRLIGAFRELTGVPMVLNTSFNENEPVVCAPEEALDCFLRTRMDVLVMGETMMARAAED